ncbi:MAG TPA: hypothetical protein VK890_07840, partial [Bacteroidia bacterium]|nr:hypothetical protein [Bacteroidia bacterium]
MRPFFNVVLLVFSLLSGVAEIDGQGLEHLPPVLKGEQAFNDTTVSFIWTAMDLRPSELNRPPKYFNCLQIVDADEPWPPRWYYAIPFAAKEEQRD